MTKSSETQSDADFAAQAFSTLAAAEVSLELKRRVAQIPLVHERQEKIWYWPFDHLWQPSLALAAVALLGVLTGSVFDISDSTTSDVAELLDTESPRTMPTNAETLSEAPEQAQMSAMNDDEELDDLLALALGQPWQEPLWEPSNGSN